MTDGAEPGEARLDAGPRRAAESISLVLAAEGIPHRVANRDGRWFVGLDPADLARAQTALETTARENAPEPVPPPEPIAEVETQAALWLALALVAFYAWTGPWDPDVVWFERGASDAHRIGLGELWRCVTALSLHSDVAHVCGNAFSCAVFGTLLFRRYGAGVGAVLLLASGALGNWLAAEWHGFNYESVGASTALFGAIGALAATETVRRSQVRRRFGQVWLPLAAGLGLLAMLGTGKGSDLTAHVTGLAAGGALGALAAWLAPRPLGPATQLVCGAFALASVGAAWALALRAV
jgi:rhomboid protease GluP